MWHNEIIWYNIIFLLYCVIEIFITDKHIHTTMELDNAINYFNDNYALIIGDKYDADKHKNYSISIICSDHTIHVCPDENNPDIIGSIELEYVTKDKQEWIRFVNAFLLKFNMRPSVRLESWIGHIHSHGFDSNSEHNLICEYELRKFVSQSDEYPFKFDFKLKQK